MHYFACFVRFSVVVVMQLLICTTLLAQDRSIKGKVVGVDNKPLVGAKVTLVELEQTVSTDANGMYHLHIPKQTANAKNTLQIGFIGKKTKNISLVLNTEGEVSTVTLLDNSLALEEVPVVASQGQRSNSSLVFDREMIERFPALSLNDLLNRLPNRMNTGPSVQEMQNLTLRGAFSQTTGRARDVHELGNAFGVAIIVDDIAMSNNGNMGGRNPGITGMSNATNAIRPSDYGTKGRPISSTSYSGENVFGGIDLRQIPVENIESVEVISGVAPVRYGDISNGAVIVERQAGRTPAFFRLQVRSNATSYGLSKGFALGKKWGMMNLDAGYVNSYADNRDKLKQYRRINGSAIWTNTYGQVKQTLSATYNRVLDGVNKDPDDPLSNAVSFGGSNWNASSRTSITVKNSIIDRIGFNLGASSSLQTTYREYYYNGDPVFYTDTLYSGIVEAEYAPGQYDAVDHVENRPFNLNGRLEMNGRYYTGEVQHRFSLGANYSFDTNLGRGRIVDPSRPKKDLGGNASDRYYDFSLAHNLQNIGIYLDDAVRMELMGRELNMQAGVRWDIMNGYSSLSPRTNINYKLSDNLRLGVAYGISFKSPGLAHLYPGPSFEDILLLNAYNGKVAESMVIFYVHRNDVDSKGLKSSVGQTLETSLTWNKVGHSLRANLFYKRNDRVVSTVGQRQTLLLPEYKATPVPGQKPMLDITGYRRYLISDNYFTNDRSNDNLGVEVMYSTPRISAIMTSFSATAALTSSVNKDPNLESASFNDKETADNIVHIGLFPSTQRRNYLSRGSIRSSTHVPRLRLIIELSADVELLNYTKSSLKDFYPREYYTKDLTHYVVDQFDPNNAHHEELFNKRKEDVMKRRAMDNLTYWNFSLSMAKEIGKNLYLSFNVYNFLDYQPRIYKEAAGTVRAPNGTPNYGAQMTYKF
ncbi:Outer membrane receptor proteins, mostly Fe transport [Sphingobacterium nematocida]|uniref:Outer membrane receptor proteins, mostly Fe transport n=1 Tax=Sphingobacterium nematocida TaxID=1513896 RepID=A0A1T5AZV1_9SPHI|nr:TonB-dependent receptor [Sphingobacterium nematocida]SKB40290.1 Outer membrane receptor proteins, mostly Fe transport [Sphingobacterium nematocida]